MPSRPEPVSPRTILRDNLRALMGSRPDLDVIRKVVAKSGLSNGKVGRIHAGSHTTDIDALQQLANAFGLQPWQLLVEGLNPKALPELATPGLLQGIRQLVHSTERAEAGAVDESDRERVQVPAGAATGATPSLEEAIDVSGIGRRTRKQAPAGGKARGVPKPRRGRRA